jgi:hypothetical protein
VTVSVAVAVFGGSPSSATTGLVDLTRASANGSRVLLHQTKWRLVKKALAKQYQDKRFG